MAKNIRHISEEDKILALYKRGDNQASANTSNNIVHFANPACQKTLNLLDDIKALLDDPVTRPLTQDIMESALQHIARSFVSPKA